MATFYELIIPENGLDKLDICKKGINKSVLYLEK